MTDFFFFAPGSLQEEKVCRLQSKYIGKLLLKVLAAKQSLAEFLQVLRACFPSVHNELTRDMLLSMVLEKPMAEALWILYRMAHKNVDQALMDEAASKLGSAELLACHKPLHRLVGLSQYKRLVQACHEKISLDTLDKASREKAANLKEEMKTFGSISAGMEKQLENGTLQFGQIWHAIEKVAQVKVEAASLPASGESSYFQLRCDCIEKIDKDLTWLVIDSNLGNQSFYDNDSMIL